MARSLRQVVGLHEPPRKTWHSDVELDVELKELDVDTDDGEERNEQEDESHNELVDTSDAESEVDMNILRANFKSDGARPLFHEYHSHSLKWRARVKVTGYTRIFSLLFSLAAAAAYAM